MKVNGKPISGPNYEYAVVPRIDGDICFKIQAVLDLDKFEILYPHPTPPTVMKPGGVMVPDLKDVGYNQQLQNRGKARYAYLCIKSLEPSNIEWDTVDMNDVSTLVNWETDFKKAGFTNSEYNIVAGAIASANNLDQQKIDEARERFLLILRLEQEELSSKAAEQANTPSGEPASVSA